MGFNVYYTLKASNSETESDLKNLYHLFYQSQFAQNEYQLL